jgi:lysozyme
LFLGEITSARGLIQAHEGCILQSKPDEKGKWVIGWGHDVPPPPEGPAECTQEEADEWLGSDFAAATQHAGTVLGIASFSVLNAARKAALIDMAYELGAAGLAEFQKMLSAIRAADWPRAKAEALNSEWASQVPSRAAQDAEILLTGEWPS